MSPGTTIPFEEFMRRALHDPEQGYYARHVRGIGRRGDFTTAPKLSRAPAVAIARWAAAALRETGCRDLVEIGPGDGTLAAEVLARLPWSLRWRTRLHLVETSRPLTALQRGQPGLRRATWHRDPREALVACDGRAVLFSNELVDAFPVRRFRRLGGAWRELGVTFGADGSARELPLPENGLPASSALDPRHAEGQVVEVHESYRRWLEGWLPAWRAGCLLTIDYGATADTLYHRQPRGTLRGYLLQQRVEGDEVYRHIGRQDLTADVNFSDLIDWSSPWMDEQRLETLGTFLARFGVAPGNSREGLAEAGGAYDAFRVLDERRAATG